MHAAEANCRGSADRLSQALRAFMEQEISAPSAAIAGFLEILIEDARSGGSTDLMADLERMREANRRLGALIAEACARDWSAVSGPEDQSADEARLRHELRTPLNAIKGYGEMLIEDMAGLDGEPFVIDLNHVLACADQALGRIDRLAAVWSAQEPGAATPTETSVAAITDVLRSVTAAQEPASARSTGRILVVDDEPSNRDLLSRRLVREGHSVTLAENGSHALALTATADFDLILLDIMMPGISGLDVLRALKAAEATRHIPVIVISALDQIDSVVSCIEAGAEDYLPKTFDPILLRARISASLEKKALRDRDALFVNELRLEKQRSEALLLNILPQSIVTRIRQGEQAIADRFDAVTILFCDLVGFTPLAATLTPLVTVDLLGTVFSAFDRSVARRGVEKIKTMGDAYMAAGGIPEPIADHAARVGRLAFDMLADVEAIGRQHGYPLAARIGIHTGEAVAGVIGTKRFVYDVWGDTVNTAARMESHGRVGSIHVSASTLAALGAAFRSEPRGKIDIKGKGPMETFFLVSCD